MFFLLATVPIVLSLLYGWRRVPDAEFDYVVIGGGTAGLTLASRLAEDASVSVAVIEAGGHYKWWSPLFSSVPGLAPFGTGASPTDVNPYIDWGFITAPQKHLGKRKIHYARGKCLGGSSARNYMVYQRPDRGSMQMWADAVGDQSYTFDAMLPYFQKSVTFHAPNDSSVGYQSSAYAEKGGPVKVGYPVWRSQWSRHARDAMAELGFKTTPDLVSGDLIGAQYVASTIGPRMARQTSYEFVKAAKRPNLKIYTWSLAKRIVFEGKRASAVVINRGSKLSARREIVLSAGAFQSPQLLMVSGIGPKHTLEKLGIDVVADRAGVGQNLMDHVFITTNHKVNIETVSKVATSPVALLKELAFNYTLKREGILTTLGGEYVGFEKAPRNLLTHATKHELGKFPASWPDLEQFSAAAYTGRAYHVLDHPKDGHYASFFSVVLTTLSRGTVQICSPDTADPPLIDPNFLSHPVDQELVVAAVKRARALMASKAIAPLLVGPEVFPGPDAQTDAEILSFARGNAMTVWHAAGTCKMGRRGDRLAVVDKDARVIGVDGLRVVDAAAFPLLPPGHPQALVYALAEKTADAIKADWRETKEGYVLV